MNYDWLTPSIVGVIAGSIGVLVATSLARRKNLKIGEGRKIGLNLSTDQKCPACNAPLPVLRKPKNFRQMMWGGWTCDKCGAEFDKWLKPVDPK